MTEGELRAVIAANCRRARLFLNLSQVELAELAEMTQEQISRVETGRLPSLQTLIKLANALQTTPADLLTPAGASLSPRKRRPKATVAV